MTKNQRTALQICLPIVIVVGAVFGAKMAVASLPKPEAAELAYTAPLVRVITVAEAPITLHSRTSGIAAPRTETTLVSEVSGRVLEVSDVLASGGFFQAGEVLVTIDATDYELALEEARAAVARAATRLARERADADVARRDWESVGNGQEATELVLRVPEIREAEADVAAAQAMLAKAERDVDRTRVVAPYAGRVRTRAVDPGQYVMLGTELARVFAVDYAEVRLPIADGDLARLDLPLDLGSEANWEARDVRTPVTLTADFAGKIRTWHGYVDRIEGAIDTRSLSVVLVARVEDPYGREGGASETPLMTGLFLDATIEGRTIDAARIPREALRDGDVVYLISADNTLQLRTIDVLDGTAEFIVTQDLVAGERVILSPLELPVDGMDLRVEDAEPAMAAAATPAATDEKDEAQQQGSDR